MWWWTVSVGQMRARPGRAALTLSSVTIGVAAVLAVMLTTKTTRSGGRELYETVAGRASLEVVAEAGERFDSSVLELVRSTPGVRAAVPCVQAFTVIYGGSSGRVKALALGIDPQNDGLVRDYVFREGGPLTKGRQVLLEAGFARGIGVGVGHEVKILGYAGLQRFRVVGLLEPRGAAAFTNGGFLFLPLVEAQNLFRLDGQISSVYLAVDEGIGEEEIEQRLATRLSNGLVVRRPGARTEVGRETLATLERGLNLTSVMSLVAAGFIILNGFFMNLTERWRQLAILRGLGGTRRQVMGLVLGEGLMIGLPGTCLGILVGLAGAMVLTRGMGQLLQMSLPPLRITLGPVLLALVLGAGTSLLAAAIPAWFASRISPVDGFSGATYREAGKASPWPTRLGGTLLGTACGLGLSARWGWAGPQAAVWTIGLALVGAVFMLPAMTEPLLRWLAPVLHRVVGLEAWLASQHVQHRRTRTGLTAAVLFVVMVMSLAVGNAVLDNIADVKQWYRRTLTADFFVRVVMPDMATGGAAAMPEELGNTIRAIPGVETIESVRFVNAQTQGIPINVVARSFAPNVPLSLDLMEGDPEETRKRLSEGETVIATVLGKRLGLRVGDSITLSTERGEHPLRIAATTNEYTAGGLVMYLDFQQAAKILEVRGVDAFLVNVTPGAEAAVEPPLKALCDQQGLLLQSFAELTRMVDDMISGVVGGLWVLMALGFVIAAFGMANTLTMNVMEQTRELALLRVVSMTRRQLRRFIVSQAFAIAAVGLLPGAAAGVLLAFVVNQLTYAMSGHAVQFAFRAQILCGCLLVSFLIVLAAAWLPARRAARINLVEALSYE